MNARWKKLSQGTMLLPRKTVMLIRATAISIVGRAQPRARYKLLVRFAGSNYDAVRVRAANKFPVWPTQLLFVHTSFVLLLASTIFASLDPLPLLVLSCYTLGALLLYWWILLHVRRRRLLEVWWRQHVVDPITSRVSAAFFIIFLDLAHIFIFLTNLVIAGANTFYIVENSVSAISWWRAIYYTAVSLGLARVPIPLPATVIGKLVYVANGLLGYVFLGLCAAIFMKSIEAIFPFLKGTGREAPSPLYNDPTPVELQLAAPDMVHEESSAL